MKASNHYQSALNSWLHLIYLVEYKKQIFTNEHKNIDRMSESEIIGLKNHN